VIFDRKKPIHRPSEHAVLIRKRPKGEGDITVVESVWFGDAATGNFDLAIGAMVSTLHDLCGQGLEFLIVPERVVLRTVVAVPGIEVV
jgi:hypothetical protein